MTDYIMLPRAMLTEEVTHDPNLSRLLLYLLSKENEVGRVAVDTTELNREFGWTRQQSRTLISRLKAIPGVTASSTARVTAFVFETQTNSHKHQPQEQPQIQPRPVSYTPPHTLDFQDIVDTLRTDTMWRESIQRTIGLTEMQIDEALERYPDHCITQGEPKKTLKEAKFHISNWLRRQKYSAPYETKRQDRFSERRGTDPAANRPEDYTATL